MSFPGLLLVLAFSSVVQAQSRGELRLVRGNTTSYNYTSGRLEIYLNGRWGTICNDANFDRTEANVACQQLGWSGVSRYGYSSSLGFGQSNGTILLDNVNCLSPNYLHLLSCQYSTVISHLCDHSDDVAVYCNSTHLSNNPKYALQVRLAGGSYPSRGRVEVYCNGQWGTICSTNEFRSAEAETVCRQLGYTDATRYKHLNLPGNSTQPIWLKYFSCGTHSDCCLDTCTSCPLRGITTCTHFSDVTVECDYMSGYPSRITDRLNRSGGNSEENSEASGEGPNIGAIASGSVGGGTILAICCLCGGCVAICALNNSRKRNPENQRLCAN